MVYYRITTPYLYMPIDYWKGPDSLHQNGNCKYELENRAQEDVIIESLLHLKYTIIEPTNDHILLLNDNCPTLLINFEAKDLETPFQCKINPLAIRIFRYNDESNTPGKIIFIDRDEYSIHTKLIKDIQIVNTQQT